MARYAVTKTWNDGTPTNSHETFEVDNLAEAGAGVQWQSVGHGVYYGNNGRFAQADLVTYIARPTR